jgi:hypothetical protein
MSTNDKDRATVVRWTYAKDNKVAMADAKNCVNVPEDDARRYASKLGQSLWRITITVERMPNEESK